MFANVMQLPEGGDKIVIIFNLAQMTKKAQNIIKALNHRFWVDAVIGYFSNIREFQVINFGYNSWNGFYFSLVSIEIQGETKGFEGELLGLHIATDVVLLYVLFIEIEFKSPFLK